MTNGKEKLKKAEEKFIILAKKTGHLLQVTGQKAREGYGKYKQFQEQQRTDVARLEEQQLQRLRRENEILKLQQEQKNLQEQLRK